MAGKFNPDAYLSSPSPTSGGFDPDTYLSGSADDASQEDSGGVGGYFDKQFFGPAKSAYKALKADIFERPANKKIGAFDGGGAAHLFQLAASPVTGFLQGAAIYPGAKALSYLHPMKNAGSILRPKWEEKTQEDLEGDVSEALLTLAPARGGLASVGKVKPAFKPAGPVKASVRAIRSAFGNEGATQRQAADILRGSTTDYAGATAALEAGSQEIIPGSKPTTFQQTGDLGLGQLEREQRNKNPGIFNERSGDQNAARRGALEGVQSEGAPTDMSTYLTDQFNTMDAAAAKHVDELAEAARGAAAKIGGTEAPEAYGEAARGAILDAEKVVREHERGLWKAVDPDRKLMVDSAELAQDAKGIQGKMSSSAKPMEGEEAAIHDVIMGYKDKYKQGDNVPFADLVDLRSRISAAMRKDLRDAGAPTPAYARLTELRQSVQNNIIKTAEEAAQERLGAATQATRERVSDFGRGPVQQAIFKAGERDVFKLPEARVPEKFWHKGPTGATDAGALIEAIGPEPAQALLTDFASMSLRRAAMSDTGVLDPKKFQMWVHQHSDALRALPPEVRAQFTDAATAARAVDEAAAARAAMTKSAQSGSLAKIMNADHPEDVTRMVGSIFGAKDSVARMKQLASAVSGDEAATAGLRQSVADHISNKFISNTEVGTSGVNAIKSDQFQTFLRQNRAALSQVFTPAEIKTLGDIAKDMHRANRSNVSVKVPAGPGTAQDTYALRANAGRNPSMLRYMIDAVVGGAAHTLGGGWTGIIATIGTDVLQALRMRGINKIDDLVTEAILNPEVANALLKQVPDRPGAGAAAALTRALRRNKRNKNAAAVVVATQGTQQ